MVGSGDLVGSAAGSTGLTNVTLSSSTTAPLTGGFLAVGPTPGNPDGLLGRVTDIHQQADGTTVVTTTPALLTDAFPSGSIHYSGPLNAVVTTVTKRSTYLKSGAIPLGDIIGIECEGTIATLNLGLSVSAGIEFDMDWGLGSTMIRIVPSLTVEATASESGGVEVTCGNESPSVVGFSVPIAGIPVAFSERLFAELGGKLAAFNAELKAGYTIRAGIEWRDGETTPITSSESKFEKSFKVNQPEGSVSIAFGVGLSAKIFDVVGVVLKVGTVIEVKISSDGAEYRCVATAKFELKGQLEIGRWGFSATADIAAVAFGQVSLGSVGCGTPPPPSIPQLALPTAATGRSYTYTLSGDGGSTPLNWSVSGLPAGLGLSGDTISGSPTAAGQSSLTVTLVDSRGRTATATTQLLVRTGLGGLNMAAACTAQQGAGTTAVAFDTGNAYSWKCRTGIDISARCRVQYGAIASARVTNPSNAFSWDCTKSGPVNIGGLNMAAACTAQQGAGTTAVAFDTGNAYSWKCRTGIDISARCRVQYGATASARVTNPSNAYSWDCVRGGISVGGVDLAAACRDQRGSAATVEVLNTADAYSWHCLTGINTDAQCVASYGAGAAASFTNQRDAYSWYCWRTGQVTAGGVDLAAGCTDQRGSAATVEVLNTADAYSWHCLTGINTDAQCVASYGAGAAASFTNQRDAYSWYCHRG